MKKFFLLLLFLSSLSWIPCAEGQLITSSNAAATYAPLAAPSLTGAVTIGTSPSLTITDTTNGTDFTMTNSTAATSSTPTPSPIFSPLGGAWWGPTSPTNATAVSLPDTWTFKNLSGASVVNTSISNVAETSAVVTLTISGGTFSAGTNIEVAGLTTATWLNGLTCPTSCMTLITANATTLTFLDPTNHANQGSTSETGSVFSSTSVARIDHSGAPGSSLRTFSNVSFFNNTAATVNTSSDSPSVNLNGTYWTGSASAFDNNSWQNLVGIGSNPTVQMLMAHQGSTGPVQLAVQPATTLCWNGTTGLTCDTGISRSAAHIFQFGNGTQGNNTAGVVASYFQSRGTKFTASGCSNTTLQGGAAAGSYASGTTGTCTVVITFGDSDTATNGWACFANDVSTPADVQHQTTPISTTQATISGTTVSGDVVTFGCTAY